MQHMKLAFSRPASRVLTAIAFYGVCGLGNPALAHHPMGGTTPATFMQGFLSGLGHPVIGVDHLLFILAAGAVVFFFGQRLAVLVALLLGTLAGTLLHVRLPGLPWHDALVALSLVVLGVLLFRHADLLKGRGAVLLFALSGIAHGYAYGEAVVGAETTPLAAYLLGFSLIQLALALAAYGIARYAVRGAAQPAPRWAGGVLAMAGFGFFLAALLGS